MLATEAPTANVVVNSERVRVLIVDDDHDAAEMLEEELLPLGYVTRTAGDGYEALKAAERFAPHVALLDLGLPEMNGIELAKKLRALPGLATLRLVAMTGYGKPKDLALTKEAGFDEHLVKPLNLDELTKVISRLTAPQPPAMPVAD